MEIWPRLYHPRPDYPRGSRARFEGIMAAALLHQRIEFLFRPPPPAFNKIYYFFISVATHAFVRL